MAGFEWGLVLMRLDGVKIDKNFGLRENFCLRNVV